MSASHLADVASKALNMNYERKTTDYVYASAMATQEVSRTEMSEMGLDARLAYRFIKDELLLDGNPSLNLASFVTTWQEPEAEELMRENFNKNFIDAEEYPSCAEIEKRCVNMVGRMLNVPIKDDEDVLGVSTVGSSEAIILAVLAAKKRWQQRRKAAGLDCSKPNLVASSAVQVCVEKAARYLDVEERWLPVTETRFKLDPQGAVDLCDENTIAIVVIHGTTYTGHYEDVKAVNDLLLVKNKEKNWDIHIHVDGASGAFVSPWTRPDLVFDFRLPLVASINTSGHKYGLAQAGVGFLIMRSKEYLPQEIIFTVNYLGSDQLSFTLNFSKSAVQLIGQYYQLLRLGKAGYRAVMSNLHDTAEWIAKEIEGMGIFTILSDREGKGVPLVAWKLTEPHKFDEFAIASTLRSKGWIVPAYTMAPNATKMKLMRVVVREDLSRSRAHDLIRDLKASLATLEKMPQAVIDHQKQQTGSGNDASNPKQSHAHEQKEQHFDLGNSTPHLHESTGKTNLHC